MEIKLTKKSQILNEIQALRDLIEGGLTHRNIKQYRNTYVINAQDSLDATYPMLVPFNVISEMTKMISVKVSFWILPFRAYCDNSGDESFGIYEEDNSPSIKFSVSQDGGITYRNIIGTYSTNKLNIEITSLVNTIGAKILKFESTARARLMVQVEIKLDISR
ncbi:unnamed protein product [marine sediment metagenome]|uniref:Uncharacterized protein n=1 Tax=marine sediment metagenome TaxID=412755 RepID=X0ZLN3_9ZZZZ